MVLGRRSMSDFPLAPAKRKVRFGPVLLGYIRGDHKLI
jgi:hypothetical protein